MSIKSFPDYKRLLQENYVEYKHIQGEHKVFPWLQTFITRKLRGIQTYTFFQNVTLLETILETNLSNDKKIYLYST